MNNKRGLSSVVTTVLLILVTVVGVSFLWVFASKITKNQSDDYVDPDCFNFNLDLANCRAYGFCNYGAGLAGYDAEITVSRSVGKGNVSGLRFIFENSVGFKTPRDKNYSLAEATSFRFTNNTPYPGDRIGAGGLPDVVSVAALMGANKDVCPIASKTIKCSVVQLPPPTGSNPSTPQCCMQAPYNFSECYTGNVTGYPVNAQGIATNGLPGYPYFYKSVCCGAPFP